jgi:hypothetical protein
MLLHLNKKTLTAAVLAAASPLSFASAVCPTHCTAPLTAGNHTENRAYAGLVWTLGGQTGLLPSAVVGARSLAVKDNDSVSGGDVSVRLNVFGGFGVDSLRVVYVGGSLDVQGNIGLGYSFVGAGLLVTAGVQGPYSRLGADYVVGSGAIVPYAEINSRKKPERAGNGGSLSCPVNYHLVNASGVGASASQTVNGQTCALMA